MAETSTGKAQISWREPEMGAGAAPVVVCSCRIDLQTRQRTEVVDLTDQCDELVARSRLAEGFLQLFCAHTTCTLMVNENERGFHEDLAGILERLAPQDRYWAHDDLARRRENLEKEHRPNGFSHVRACLTGHPALAVPIEQGRLALGRWQRVLLVELDGGRRRRLTAHVWGVSSSPPATAVSSRRPPRPRAATQPTGQGSAPPASWPSLRSELARCIGVEAVTHELARVEELLRASVQTGDSSFTEAAGYLVAAGGKRLRPLLTLASGHAGRHVDTAPASDRMITAAAAVELLHLGTLYHDDVIDEAETRRGWPSVNARWGNTVAVLAGDVLLASAWGAAASLGGEEAHLLSRTLATMCRGEALETQRLFDVERDESAYEEAIAGKTACLLATSCRLGALVAGLDRPLVDSLTSFGHNLGMAFQIVDDVLDLTGTDEVVGKPTGRDLPQGVYTLPVIRALRESEELRGLLGRPLDEETAERAGAIILSGDAIATSRSTAETYVREAIEAIAAHRQALDDRILEGLERLGQLLLDRSR
jgi:heptaprenyl diphosphate synthase